MMTLLRSLLLVLTKLVMLFKVMLMMTKMTIFMQMLLLNWRTLTNNFFLQLQSRNTNVTRLQEKICKLLKVSVKQ